jgi:putative hydrolase of the HAD superfamily
MGFMADTGITTLALDIDGTLYSRFQLNTRMIRSLFPNVRLSIAFNWARKEIRRIQDGQPLSDETREGFLDRQAALVAQRYKKDVGVVKESIDTQFYRAWERTFTTITPFPYLRETLEQVKREGVRIILFSDFPIAEKPMTLGIADLVDDAFTSEESGYLKPSVKAFEYLIGRVGAKRSKILYIGDSYDKDCIGAADAGLVSWYLGKKKAGPKASRSFASWSEIKAVI